jgi:hypothetical protein
MKTANMIQYHIPLSLLLILHTIPQGTFTAHGSSPLHRYETVAASNSNIHVQQKTIDFPCLSAQSTSKKALTRPANLLFRRRGRKENLDKRNKKHKNGIFRIKVKNWVAPRLSSKNWKYEKVTETGWVLFMPRGKQPGDWELARCS